MGNFIYEGRKYRSKLESMVGSHLGPQWSYEPFQVDYITHRRYTPDFVYGDLLVEVKGFFRVGDTQKYKAIKQDLAAFQELVFYLNNPKTKVRKGGKLNMGEWCTKEGFVWFDNVYDLKIYGET